MTSMTEDDLRSVDAWWRAANYLSVGQIYLRANPLLREPLRREHVKRRLLGHWGTCPGVNFLYAHATRLVRDRGLDAMFLIGPGHGGAAMRANTWLEGTYSEHYPEIGQDVGGLTGLCRQFSWPNGFSSHADAQTPGSIHEGGELGYSLSHAYGAMLDAPGALAVCMIGDGEDETGPLQASWNGSRFANPRHDGAVLPVMHLNGYKIANPSVLARMTESEVRELMEGRGHRPWFVEAGQGKGHDEDHHALAAALEEILDAIGDLREGWSPGDPQPRWPALVLRSPKGWTGPNEIDGEVVEGHWRSHQIPIEVESDDDLGPLEEWLRSYRPDELFDEDGAPAATIRELRPGGRRAMGANERTNGGRLARPLELPDIAEHAVAVHEPGTEKESATSVLGGWLRDVTAANPERFRIVCPDEIKSNKLGAVLEVTDRQMTTPLDEHDDDISPRGQVLEVLSEHLCEGWLEGYLLTGRHGLFVSYEAFVHVADSMFNQHAKWRKMSREVPWRRPAPSLNYLLSSHVWEQDHNGFSHQSPGFLDLVTTKKSEVVRAYLPPDANSLLWVADHCLRSTGRINVIVAGKTPGLQYLDVEAAGAHCQRGAGIWEWASNDEGGEPDVIMASAGDTPTTEALAATDLLRAAVPDVRVRFVNVVDLMALEAPGQHPHGLGDAEYESLFGVDVPVIFAFHGYPWLIHRLTYRRPNHENLHVHGFVEEGTTTTPFDMVVRNRLDRFHLALAAIDRVPRLRRTGAHLRQELTGRLMAHHRHVADEGDDLLGVSEWQWTA